eukprot:11109985-Alexandrium_andersonii.AAC.1
MASCDRAGVRHPVAGRSGLGQKRTVPIERLHRRGQCRGRRVSVPVACFDRLGRPLALPRARHFLPQGREIPKLCPPFRRIPWSARWSGSGASPCSERGALQ